MPQSASVTVGCNAKCMGASRREQLKQQLMCRLSAAASVQAALSLVAALIFTEGAMASHLMTYGGV